MNTDFETPMAALFSHLVAAAQIQFSADATANDATLTSVSSFEGLFEGLPVFGDGVQDGAVIQSLDQQAGTITLSEPLTQAGSAVSFTTGFLTTGRRVKHWNQVAAQPALFLRRVAVTDEEHHENNFIVTTLDCEAWIYCNAGKDPDAAPDAALTCLERMVRQSFKPDSSYGDERFTLGGLVFWCRFAGRSDISPGDQGPQAIARMPIRVTLDPSGA